MADFKYIGKSLKKCYKCNGTQKVAGPNEYEIVPCPECNREFQGGSGSPMQSSPGVGAGGGGGGAGGNSSPYSNVGAGGRSPGQSTMDFYESVQAPLYRGLFQFFPKALTALAQCSQICNDQHAGPGQPIRYVNPLGPEISYDKMLRHLQKVGELDTDTVPHEVKVAWRAIEALEKFLEGYAKVEVK